MIVEECHKILPGFAVRTDERVLDLFAAFENFREFRNVAQSFDDVRHGEEKRVVQRGINTKTGLIRAVPAHKTVNCFLVIVDFAKGQKIPFPQCLSEFPDCVTESFDRRGRDVFGRVDAETIKIKFCDQILVGVNQNI